MHILSFRGVHVIVQYRRVGIVKFILVAVRLRVIRQVVSADIKEDAGQHDDFYHGIVA